jgi:hypothetical protein
MHVAKSAIRTAQPLQPAFMPVAVVGSDGRSRTTATCLKAGDLEPLLCAGKRVARPWQPGFSLVAVVGVVRAVLRLQPA